jgi:hypothetical protein
MIVDDNGMKRSDAKPMYRKIPFVAMQRKALAMTKGSLTYDDGLYDRNWQRAIPESAAACFDHAIEHLWKYIEGDTSEDHLAHAACNIDFLMWYEDNHVFDPSGDTWATEPEPEPEPVVEEVQKQTLLAKVQGLLIKK